VEAISAVLAENKRTQLEEKIIFGACTFSPPLFCLFWDEVWSESDHFHIISLLQKNPPPVDVSRCWRKPPFKNLKT